MLTRSTRLKRAEIIPTGTVNVPHASLQSITFSRLISTVVDDFLPSLTVSVRWKKHHSAKLGNTLKPKQLKRQPTIALRDETAGGDGDGGVVSRAAASAALTYTIALTDPDAPSRDNPRWSEFCHWIATNVSISEDKTFSVLPLPEFGLTGEHEPSTDGDGMHDIVSYKPPGPPRKTGKHRYVFLVFAPLNGTTEPLHLSKPKERRHWGTGTERGGVREWARANGLVPVAANFVYSKNTKQ